VIFASPFWLDEHSGTVAAIATVALVVVTIVYFKLRLVPEADEVRPVLTRARFRSNRDFSGIEPGGARRNAPSERLGQARHRPDTPVLGDGLIPVVHPAPMYVGVSEQSQPVRRAIPACGVPKPVVVMLRACIRE
jgi:hypothetical protein